MIDQSGRSVRSDMSCWKKSIQDPGTNAAQNTPYQPSALHWSYIIAPYIEQDALYKSIPLAPQSSAAGKLIRELQLRTRTGASIVGIERNGSSVINPGPDDELLPGDRVLLIGTATQLAAARGVLQNPAA